MYVEYRFHLDHTAKQELRRRVPQFGYGLFGQVVYLDHYSRNINGVKEQWSDTVIRVIEGVFSIRKDFYIKNRISWCEDKMQRLAIEMAFDLFALKWSPSGRGLWAMGTDLMYFRGAMFLYNCALTKLEGTEDFCWLMDSLMCGAGVSAVLGDIKLNVGTGEKYYNIPDTREGWVHSVRLLLQHYLDRGPLPIFDYFMIRGKGEPLKMFGGTSSGAGPLIDLHDNIHYVADTNVAFAADLCNLIGCCVVAGNVRRSAEMLLSPPCEDFRNLKNTHINPYREPWGWMSNNTEILKEPEDFENIKLSSDGEPVGYLNQRNLQYGRLKMGEVTHVDEAIGVNPCGEIPLEHREVCNVAETLPTRCTDFNDWYRQIRNATFYTTTVALLPTHQPMTNAIIRKNRRIGVGIVDYIGWVARYGVAKIIKVMRTGYGVARQVNQFYAADAGVPESVRVTTIKPGGTMPKLAGCNPGISYPLSEYIIRRKRVSVGSEMADALIRAGIPYETDEYSDNTLCFEFPVYTGCRFKEPSLWQQALNLVTMQREWADNAVSNTLWYNGDEDLTNVAASIMPMIKSVSFIQRDGNKYAQMPEEAISFDEYCERTAALKPFDLSVSEDGVGESYCTGETCEILGDRG